ncbi:MAG TPA: hypothetical protein VG714_09195 [Acidobacteriaceae bacterium]|nr:hypothetical protein [Acidobacteriaceae bacterium]
MSLTALFSLEGPDILAFVVCAALGFFAGSLAPQASGLYITALVAYHLFLAWLIFFSGTSFSYGGDAQKRAAISLPIGHTLLTHAACLAVILGPVAAAVHTLAAVNANADPAAGAPMRDEEIYTAARAICGLMASLAIFERRWLFSADTSHEPAPVIAAPPPELKVASVEDMQEWQKYLATRKSGALKPGTSLKTEFEQWLLARQRTAAAPPDNPSSQA